VEIDASTVISFFIFEYFIVPSAKKIQLEKGYIILAKGIPNSNFRRKRFFTDVSSTYNKNGKKLSLLRAFI